MPWGSPLALKLFTLIVFSLAPAAAALAIVAVHGALPTPVILAVIIASLLAAAMVALAVTRRWTRRAERIEAVSEALAQHRAPSHVISDSGDSMSRAERHLLQTADALVIQFDSLEEQREEFEAILRSMTEAVVVTGTRGEVVLMNGAARLLFGLAANADYTGRHFVELCRDPRLQEFAGRATTMDDGAILSAELVIQTPAPRHLEVSAAPVRHGGAAARVLVFHDITRLKSYETARTDFIANLTHELRTPLSALCGYAETLVQGVDDRATEHRFLSIIERQSRRLARLIDDLVSLSNLERGLTPLKLEPLDACKLAGEIVDLVRDQARRLEIELELRCVGRLPQLLADHDRMHQVLLNVLDNALKYTPRGGHVITEVRASDGNNGKGGHGIAFIVSDTGEGIPAADIPRLTERFYRVDRARSRELGGTGLGLAIVKHILQIHQGVLGIESRVREGTTVTIWLPATE